MSLNDHGSSAQNKDTRETITESEEWALRTKVVHSQERNQAAGIPPRELGVTWRNLTVEVVNADAALHDNFISQFNPRNLARRLKRKSDLRAILSESHGCVKPGEMLLVLGRPGSGCSTLLSLLANKREGYAKVSGDIYFGCMTAKEAEQHRGQIIINTEEELFFPTLKVGQTLDFATRLRETGLFSEGVTSKEEHRVHTRDFLLESMGISHTSATKVGNEFVRGVSGGERKRVSIIECLATKGSVFCWDNSTRGLDANSALEYVKAIRAMTDVLGLTTIVTLYQAGNGIYNLFDKVLVLDEGKQIFYGTRQEARPFMEDLGFICQDGANVADFLTGVTVPTERKVRRQLAKPFPRSATEFLAEYKISLAYKRMTSEYGYPDTEEARERTQLFRESIRLEKDRQLPARSPLVVGFIAQVMACITRQYQIIWGDKATFFIKQISNILQALISGSLWYNAPSDSTGLFMKNGALFFSILYQALVAMSEVTDSFTGRPILLKHKSFAFHHPAALCIAQIVADIPVTFCFVTTFSLIMYFMIAFDRAADTFFTYWIFLFSVSMCMTAMFRAIGAIFNSFNKASQVAGFVLPALVIYIGFLQRKPQMHPWFVWIFWIDPLAYAFDSLMSSQFHDTIIPCAGNNLVPNGPGYDDLSHQSCSGVTGALPRQPFVYGNDYLASLHYGHSHLWRNFGFIWAFWLLFVVITIIATSRWRSSAARGPSLLIPYERAKAHAIARQADEERQAAERNGSDSSVFRGSTEAETSDNAERTELVRNSSVYTWKNVSYTVSTPDGERMLLDNVQGWVKPGMLGALMGSSGAGKTTLLDVLAQRKTEGTIRGSILVDGRPLPISFQRSAGYCEQLDVHEPYATVREALEFSALLRQSREIPREEKLKYVDIIINLLELQDLADTLIGTVGHGLNVEQRKRVTIGVELVAKPSILIFLDEPTSGLDGQSAYNTVRFLRKLAAHGQAVLVTIHQPSAQLFAQFDTLLLLAKGGKTVYFGDIGEQAQTVRDYFAANGAPCPQDANPAEHMIDVVSGHLSKGRDWNQIWLSSPEYTKVTQELDAIVAEAAAKPPGTLDDGHEFAMPLWEQTKLVTNRMNISLYRNIDYVNNKMILHITSALFNGFTFWRLGNTQGDLQSRIFAIWNFIFVAPGVIAQLQPLFMARRDIFEAREKKSKMYSWVAFVTGLIVSEIPYLVICGVLYFVCWYFTVGFPAESTRAGGTFFVVLAYEFLYTGIGQFVAAYAPNPVFASLVNPLVVSMLVSFCGILVPYPQLQAFWRYWMYWLDPFTYLMGSMSVFTSWGIDVVCTESEFSTFDPPKGSTCGAYLSNYTQDGGLGSGSNLVNPDAVEGCKVCPYRKGDDYLRTIQLEEYYFGWRDAGIVVIFVISSYALVFLMMKLRTKTSKKAQ